jgi:hypothetical protein
MPPDLCPPVTVIGGRVDNRYMKYLIISLSLFLIFGIAVEGSELLQVGEDIRLPLPEQWHSSSETPDLPLQLLHSEYPAEMLVFRSEITTNEIITDEVTLKAAVDVVIEDVIMTLPGAKLLTSTGFYDGFRTGFILEFTSVDSVGGRPLRHRLKGIIYRHPDNHQMLFTVWGKCTVDDYPALEQSIVFIQDGFEFQGEHTASVFGPPPRSWWPLTLIILGVIALFYYFRSRAKRSDPLPLPAESHFWHCGCGRANHEEQARCRRCGRPRVSNGVS